MIELLLLWFSTPDLTPQVAVRAAYSLVDKAPAPEPDEHCGLCKDGVITHADGHKTPCPCPADCKCKSTK